MTILIGSHRGSPWLQSCIDSIPTDFSVIVCRNGGYECGTLAWAQQRLLVDEFLYLPDSTVIKDTAWIYRIFGEEDSFSVNCDPSWGGSFMAKYRMFLLKQLVIPITATKQEAVIAEVYLMDAYRKLCAENGDAAPVLWPEMNLANAIEETVHGRQVMRYESPGIIKYKSCWGTWMIDEINERDRLLHP